METIHYSRCQMVPTASSLAFQLGYLTEEADALTAGKLELAIGDFDHANDRLWLRHAGTTKPLWARSLGADTRAIGLSWHDSAQPIFALPGSGIAAPADLKGRRIALVRVTNQLFDVERAIYIKPYVMALASAGLSLADVQIVDTALEREHAQNAPPKSKNIFAQIAEIFAGKLLNGEVDAIATPLPADIVRKHDLTKIYDGRGDPNPDARTDLRGLVVSAALLRERRDTVVRLVARLILAGQWAAAHASETGRHLAADLGLDENVLRLRGIDPARLTQIDCAEEQIAFLGRKKDFLRASGMVERDFALADWVDVSVLRNARAMLAVPQAAPAA